MFGVSDLLAVRRPSRVDAAPVADSCRASVIVHANRSVSTKGEGLTVLGLGRVTVDLAATRHYILAGVAVEDVDVLLTVAFGGIGIRYKRTAGPLAGDLMMP
jgi:hypothetical protein